MKYSENQIKQLRQDSLKFVNGALSTAKAWNKQFQENVEAAGEPKKSRIKPKIRAILHSAIGIVLKVLGMVFLKIEPEFMHFDESSLSREEEYETPIDIYRRAMRIHERVTNVLAEKLKIIRDGINDDEYLIRFYEGCIDVIT